MKELLKQLKEYKDNPGKLSEYHLLITHHYFTKSQELEDLIEESVFSKRELLMEQKSVAKADRLYDLSELGVKERKLKIHLKSLGKLLSSVRGRMATLSEESRNQY